MSKQYDDSRFGIEKILTFPGEANVGDNHGNASQMSFNEDIILTEFGIVITERYTAGGTGVVQLRESSTVLGQISTTSVSVIGTLLTTVTLTTTAINRGDTLILYASTTCFSTGKCRGYIKYRERFVGA